jgi:lipopolysaccharide/colanic/teichoic acid biosynthesis glycosyltransferase
MVQEAADSVLPMCVMAHRLNLSPKKGIPRIVEAVLALAGLVVISPLLGLGAILVALSSPGPILYRQERMGLHGRKFILYKFRSMRINSSALQVTAKNDGRVTWAGKFLRKTKIDELPELWNVLRGYMSVVGPRPEVERYVNLNNPLWKQVLAVRPGITDPVTLSLRNEEELLGNVKGDPEEFYLGVLQPLKLQGYVDYLGQRDAWRDFVVILWTIVVILLPNKAPAFSFLAPSAPHSARKN